MLDEASAVEKLAGRMRFLELALEKNRGDFAESLCALRMEAGLEAEDGGISSRRGGDLPVRAFLLEEGSMACSRLACLEERLMRGGCACEGLDEDDDALEPDPERPDEDGTALEDAESRG